MQKFFSRREWLITSGALAASAISLSTAAAAARRRPLLGFSLYGMKQLPLSEALAQCAAIGYQCVELPVLENWPADSAKFSEACHKKLRDDLAKHRLRLSALMENLPARYDDGSPNETPRLKAAAEIARNIDEKNPPLVETILGGRPDEWEHLKPQFVNKVGEWSRIMADAKVKLAIKAHVSNAMQTPAQLQWLLDQVNSPWVTAAYDFSHFELQKMEMPDTIKPLANRLSFVHVKDTRGEPGKFQFLLPGEGRTDYSQLFRLLAQAHYAGDIVVEVSGQIHSKPDYDGVAAAKKSFAALAPAMQQFGGEQP